MIVNELLKNKHKVASFFKYHDDKLNGKKTTTKTGKIIVKVDPSYYRPAEVDMLIGDPSKAKKKLGWKSKTSFEKQVKIMVQSDMKKLEIEVDHK